MGTLIGLAAVVMIFSIPLFAIWTSYQIKLKKMEMDGDENTLVGPMKKQTLHLLNKIELQQERIKALEQIVAKIPSVSTEDKEKLRICSHQSGTEIELDNIEKWRNTDSIKSKNNYFKTVFLIHEQISESLFNILFSITNFYTCFSFLYRSDIGFCT